MFVFGTLKKGFPLHGDGLALATFLGRFSTVRRYPLLVAGPWFAPMMLNEPGRGKRITGELYEVTSENLTLLDALEHLDEPGNFRITVQVRPVGGGPSAPAYAYVKSRSLAQPAHSGYLEEYADGRFVHPKLRVSAE